MKQSGGGKKIAIESATSAAAFALQAHGYLVSDAQEPLERARAIKVPNEIKMIRSSLRAAEAGVHKLQAALVPGISENELWSHLHQHVIATDGDYIETRLLSSGPRTNPWFQECSPRQIQAGELVGMDTDVVGRFGYYADFSRTFLCGDLAATPAQKNLYQLGVRTNPLEHGKRPSGNDLPGIHCKGVEDPAAVSCAPVLCVGARRRHDGRIPLHCSSRR